MDLTDAQVSAIRDWAAKDSRITEVRVFGSRAKGTSRDDSDVDLALTIVGSPAQDEVAIYILNAKRWERELTALLGAQADVERFDAETAPNVYRFCQEASHLIYTRPPQKP